MDWSVLLQAVGLMLVFEGLWPFVAPLGWRDTMRRISQMPDRRLRLFALLSMAAGLLLLWCAH